MKKLIYSVSLLVIFLTLSCGGGDKNEKQSFSTEDLPVKMTQVSLGMVHPNLAFDDDPGLSYAVYLPRTMKGKQTYPVLYCIDPHGKGEIPLLLYQNLADSFGYILIGCNTSKNGMTFQQSERALNQLITEVQGKYPVDKSVRILGFSGGAKVAFQYADANPNVTQLLFAGAVYALKRQTNISILGFVGIEDMNYADLVSFEVSLGKAPFTHKLIEWEGQHEFPSEKVMWDGFYFLEHDSVLNYEIKRPKISQEELMKEQLLKRKFYQSFGTKDLQWWNTEILALHQMSKEDIMYRRVLGFIGLGCYSFTQQAIQAGDIPKAEYLVQIYQWATPENEDAQKFADQIKNMKKGG